MSHNRLTVVIILLVLIMLLASIFFGLLTYWLEATALSASGPGQGSSVPCGPLPQRWGTPRAEALSGASGADRAKNGPHPFYQRGAPGVRLEPEIIQRDSSVQPLRRQDEGLSAGS